MRPIVMRKNMQRGCSNLGKYRWLARCAVAIGVMVCSLTTGAVTITQEVNRNPELCKQFLAMVKAAGIPHMTDAQLCNFRFAQLPRSKAQGFTFLHWHPLQVADPAGMYVRMLEANQSPHPQADLHSTNGVPAKYVKAWQTAKRAARMHQLAFYTAEVPVSEFMLEKKDKTSLPKALNTSQWTIVSMQLSPCLKFHSALSGSYYALFAGPNFQQPIPSIIAWGGGEISVWQGKLVQLYIPHKWLKLGSEPPDIFVELDNLWWGPWSQGGTNGALAGGTHCSLSIDKKGKR